MKCEEKVPGGKLVCIEIEAESGKTKKVKITGDFFLHPEDTIVALEHSLEGISLDTSEETLISIISTCLEGAQFIGASAADLARIFRKAVS